MVRACSSCGVGAHHWKACISNIKPPVGAPMQKPQEPLDQQFSKYPDMTKNVPEKDNLEHPFISCSWFVQNRGGGKDCLYNV